MSSKGNLNNKANKKSQKSEKSTDTQEMSQKERKKVRDQIEAQRILERDAMMNLIVSDSDDSASLDNGKSSKANEEPGSKWTVDSFGNTVSKAKLKENTELEAMRNAARARRADKELLKANTTMDNRDTPTSKKTTEEVIIEIKAKVANNIKLSHKEKKMLHNYDEQLLNQSDKTPQDSMMAESKSSSHLYEDELSSFMLSVAGRSFADDSAGKSHAHDISIPSFSIHAPSKALLVDAELTLSKGRKYALVGPNGRGKTTLLKYIASKKLPIAESIDILLLAQEVPRISMTVIDMVLAADIIRNNLLQEENNLLKQFEEQELYLSDTDKGDDHSPLGGGIIAVWTEEEWAGKLSRFTEIGNLLESLGSEKSEARARVILTGLGFTSKLQDGPVDILSGGWRMRVSLACALFLQPALLLLDEPTNHLDLNAVLWLEDYLTSTCKSTLLIVSHDADFIDVVCSDVIYLDNYKLHYYRGNFTNFYGMRDQIMNKLKEDYKYQQKLAKEYQSSTNCTIEKALEKAMKKMSISAPIQQPKDYKVSFILNSSEESGPAIDLLDVHFSYAALKEESRDLAARVENNSSSDISSSTKRIKEIFRNLRCRVDTYSRIAIVGTNGSGKSTFLKLLMGTLSPSQGTILRYNSLRIGRYDQHFEDLLSFDVTPIEFLMSRYDVTKSESQKYLGMFGLDGARHTIKIGQLSGGQKARVCFASISLQRAHIMVLDEPTNHLDIESVDALIQAIKAFEGGVVMVSHDARLIASTECELWVCDSVSSTGLRVERRGFEVYRSDILAENRRLERLAEEKASQNELLRKQFRNSRAEILRRKAIKKR